MGPSASKGIEKMNDQAKEILVSLIDMTIKKYDVNNNPTASMIYRGKTEKELDLLRYQELQTLISNKISLLNTGSATPDMQIAKLLTMRKELLNKDDRMFFNTDDQDIAENIKLIDKKIKQIENEIIDRKTTIQFLRNMSKEIELQMNLESLTV